MTKRQQAIARARIELRQAIDRACVARGEAQWTNGYRAAKFSGRIDGTPDELRMYHKELAQFSVCERTEKQVEYKMLAFAQAVRRSATERTSLLSRGRSRRTNAGIKVRRA